MAYKKNPNQFDKWWNSLTDEKLNVSRKRLTRNLKSKESRYEEIKNNKKRELEYQIQEIEREIRKRYLG